MQISIEHISQLVLLEMAGTISEEEDDYLMQIIEDEEDAFEVREAMYRVLEPMAVREKIEQLERDFSLPALATKARRKRLRKWLDWIGFGIFALGTKALALWLLFKWAGIIK